MDILSGLPALSRSRLRSPIVTWGVFDGVHRGHRRVIGRVVEWARSLDVSSAVLTFDRHPEEVLRGKKVPLLCPLEERLRRIGALGVDACIVIGFTAEFSRTTAEEFVRGIVAGRIGARGIVLGHDSRFGRDRSGDLDFLARLGREVGLEVSHSEPELHGERPISSSLIREAVFAGRLDEAAYLLGRPLSVFGAVVQGDRRGAKLGFPTANLELHHGARPPSGVFAVDVPLEGGLRRGVANIGTRPTFSPEGPETVEVHLIDYSGGPLYGRDLEVRFLRRLRDELKFECVEDLKAQIAADIEKARSL